MTAPPPPPPPTPPTQPLPGGSLPPEDGGRDSRINWILGIACAAIAGLIVGVLLGGGIGTTDTVTKTASGNGTVIERTQTTTDTTTVTTATTVTQPPKTTTVTDTVTETVPTSPTTPTSP